MREATTSERQVAYSMDNQNSNSHISLESNKIISLQTISAFLVSMTTTALLIYLVYTTEYSVIASYLFIPKLLNLLLKLHCAAASNQTDHFYSILNMARRLRQPLLLKLFNDETIQSHIQIIESHVYGLQKHDVDLSMKYLNSQLLKGYFQLLTNKS
jgi:hypothetical protein